jgi:putative ABC transport system ATP-binding protein
MTPVDRAQPIIAGLSVQCRGVGHVYLVGGSEQRALTEFDLDLRAGESLAILGPSGSGKSTVLNLLAGLLSPTEGRVFLGGEDITSAGERHRTEIRARQVGVVIQNPGRNLLPYASAEENIRFAQRPLRRGQQHLLADPHTLLSRLGLSDLAGRRTAGMSGGQQQRLAVAVGMARSPGLLLIDEPTSQLDWQNRDLVVAMIAEIALRMGTTVIAVTHDPAVAEALGRTVVLSHGRSQEHARPDQHLRIGPGGVVTLPEDLLRRHGPGTRLRIIRKADGFELVRDEPGPGWRDRGEP